MAFVVFVIFKLSRRFELRYETPSRHSFRIVDRESRCSVSQTSSCCEFDVAGKTVKMGSGRLIRVESRTKVSEIFNTDCLRGSGLVRSVTERSFTMSQVDRTACKAVKAIRWQVIFCSWGRRKEGRE